MGSADLNRFVHQFSALGFVAGIRSEWLVVGSGAVFRWREIVVGTVVVSRARTERLVVGSGAVFRRREIVVEILVIPRIITEWSSVGPPNQFRRGAVQFFLKIGITAGTRTRRKGIFGDVRVEPE